MASLPALANVAWAGSGGDSRHTEFYFTALSGQAAAVNLGDSVAMAGCGRFGEKDAHGGGEFVHFDGTRFGRLDNIRVTGSWKAREVLGFQEIGTWGTGVAGILDLAITLLPCDAPRIDGATLRIVCNIGPAGLISSPFQQEGYTLTVPGLAPFRPFTPNLGLTLFTRPCKQLDD